MTQPPPADAMQNESEEIVYCAQHPRVETTLRCGKCGTPICPKCLVMTPVGARCRSCANVRPLAMYQVNPRYLLRGLLAGLLAAFVSAYIFLVLLRAFIFFTSFIYGMIVAQAIEYASNRKRGPTMQLLGVACVLAGAFGVLFFAGWLAGGSSLVAGLAAVMAVFLRGDLLFFIFIAIAGVVAWNRLS